jgi:hypothetical protein
MQLNNILCQRQKILSICWHNENFFIVCKKTLVIERLKFYYKILFIFYIIFILFILTVLLVEETGVPGEYHHPVIRHLQTLSPNVVSPEWDSNSR